MKKISILFVLIAATACSGRLPSSATTTRLIRSHFNSYAKKYETSAFGKKKVVSVELLKVGEIHKHLISVSAFVTMTGPDVHKVRVTIEKGPFGWRYISWENLGGG